MVLRPALLLIPLLAACNAGRDASHAIGITHAPQGIQTPRPQAPSEIGDTLRAHVWTLAQATDARGARIDALFPPGAEGRLAFATPPGRDARGPMLDASLDYGCNTQGARLQLDAGGVLRPAAGDTGLWMGTAIGCPALNAAEQAATRLLSAPVHATVTGGTSPALVLTAADGTRATWHGLPTDATRQGQPGMPLALEVDPTPVRCPAPALHVAGCLRVRVVGDDHALPPDDAASTPRGDWFVVEAIARHAHDPRRRQVIRVRRFDTREGPRYVFEHAIRSVAADTTR